MLRRLMEMENKCLGRQLFLVIYQEEDEGGGGVLIRRVMTKASP